MKPFLCWLSCFLLLTPVLSAQDSILERRIDFQVSKVSLEAALYQLMEEADINISFSNRLLPADQRFSYQFQQITIGDILAQMLSPHGLAIEQVGNQLVIVRAAPPPEVRYTISGYLRDRISGEPLIGANIYDPSSGKGTTTNPYGFYSLTIPSGDFELVYSYLGYQSVVKAIRLQADRELMVELEPSLTLEEIVITAPTDQEIFDTEGLGSTTFNLEEVSQFPALGGESDLLRLSYLLPGVQTGADGFGGLSVRGGNVDQNLILMDGVPVYNSTHLLGIFSVFNTSAVRSTRFYRGVFPARYGGRASSVLDVRTKEGNRKHWQAEGDLGLLSGKVSLEGPLKEGRSSFFISGRRSLIDLYSRPLSRNVRSENGIEGELGYFFYDLNTKVNWKINDRHRIFASLYNGGDNYTDQATVSQWVGEDSLQVDDVQQVVGWGNTIGSLRWNWLMSPRLFVNSTLTYSRFFYGSQDLLESQLVEGNNLINRDYLFYQYNSNNRDWAFAIDFDYLPNPDHYIRFGLNSISHKFQPGAVVFDETVQLDTLSPESVQVLLEKTALYSAELEGYVEDEFSLGDQWQGNLGVRGSLFYAQDRFRFYLQPRLRLDWNFATNMQFGLGAGRHVQPLHLLSNSGIGLPRDLWVSATSRIDPIDTWIFTLGWSWEYRTANRLEIEGYYKNMQHLLTFQEGSLLGIDATNWQNKVAVGRGWSYGVELMSQNRWGAWSGWLSYSLNFARRQFEEVNLGETFPFKFDRRHNVHLVLGRKLGRNWNVSGTWTYGTGVATTLPRSAFEYNQLNLLYANFPPQFPFVETAFDNGRRNDIRLPAYHRLDIQVAYSMRKDWGKQTLTFGVYNMYNRINPLYYFIADRPDENGQLQTQLLQTSLLPVLPSIRYRVEWMGR
jgi:hypothetical protein